MDFICPATRTLQEFKFMVVGSGIGRDRHGDSFG